MQILIKPKHFVQRWHNDTYPVFRGNPHSAGDMTNCDITSPNYMQQGKGTVALTAGTQAGAITTLLKGMTNAVTDNVAYGVGGAKLQKFSSTAVTNAGIFPHTITGTGAITGEDVAYYKSKLYYSYNDANTPSGDVGVYDLATTFTDSYFVTGLSGTALQNAPHQMVSAGNQRLYIANGQYVAVIDGTGSPYTATDAGFDFYDPDKEISSIVWNHDKLYIAANKPALTGANANQSAIYTWTGFDDSYEGDPTEVGGRISALYVKNGITFVWYESRIGTSAINTFGYLGDGRVVPLATFDGTLPEYYQVSERGDYIIWVSGNLVYTYGSLSEQTVGLSQLMTSTYATSGGIAAPFGEIVVASNATTNYNLAKESGYTVSSTWKSLVFPVSSGSQLAQIDRVVVWTESITSGGKLDTTIRYNAGASTKALDQIITGKTRHIIGARDLPSVEDFRLELNYANGSVTHPVKVKQIEVDYHLINSK